MRLSILLVSLLVILAVLSCADAKKKKKAAGPCKVKDCKKCNLTGKKCKVCNTGYKPKQKGKKCAAKPCFTNPCQNGGTCSANKKKEEKCTCPDGYSGARCETKDEVPNWRDDLRCGPDFTLASGEPAECDPNSKAGHVCCSDRGWCGKTDDHCKCDDCIDYGPGPAPLLAFTEETNIEQGKNLGRITMHETWRVSFEIKVNEYSPEWRDALHFTRGITDPGVDGGPKGDKPVALFTWPAKDGMTTTDAKFMLCYPFKAALQTCTHTPDRIKAGEWTSIVFEQVKEGANTVDRVTVNGKLQDEKIHTEPFVFEGVEMFMGDPWHPSTVGSIRNLKVVSPL